MQVRFIDKTNFLICGYSVETSLEESKHDVTALYTDYFSSGKATVINNATKNKAAEYYGLMWYLEGHERYRYLLGKDYDGVKAWTDFFSEAIPEAGYTPNYEHGFFFEYYPGGVNGNYELWTPVVKADV